MIFDSDAGKWRMALCKNMGGGYQTLLMQATAHSRGVTSGKDI